MKYHLSELNTQDKEAVEVVRTLIKEYHFYKLTEKSKAEYLNFLETCLSHNIYKVAEARVIVDKKYAFVSGHYDYSKKIIYVCNTSLITFLHEYRHHLQYQLKELKNRVIDKEVDARRWSLSVFYQASPRNFLKSVKARKILFVGLQDIQSELEQYNQTHRQKI